MKFFAVVFVACMLAGANANFLDTLKDTFSKAQNVIGQTVSTIKEPFNHLLTVLETDLKNEGAKLLSTGASSILGSLSTLGKRDASIMDGISSFLVKGQQAINSLSEKVLGVYHGALTAFNKVAAKIGSLEFLKEPVSKIEKEISSIVDMHNVLQSGVMETITKSPTAFLAHAAESLISKITHKRGIVDTVSSVGKSLSTMFAPVVGTLKEHVQNVGSALSATLKGLVASLSQQLSGHVANLKQSATELLGHGKNAIDALKSAAVDIFAQTMENAKPTLGKLLATGKDAVNTLATSFNSGS